MLSGSSSSTCFKNLFKGLDIDLKEPSNGKLGKRTGTDNCRVLHPTKLGRRTQVVLGISPSTFKQTGYGGIGNLDVIPKLF